MNKRPLNYMRKSIDELLRAYEHETQRINQEDAEITKQFIRNELLERVKDACRNLDLGAPADTVYKFFNIPCQKI